MTEWYCPICGGPNTYPVTEQQLQCEYCSRSLGMSAIVCPACGQVWPNEVDNCPACNEPLSTIAAVFHRHETAGQPPTWLERNRQQAEQVKRAAEAGSAVRMGQYQAQERQRLQAIRQSEQDQRVKDRRLFLYVSIFAVSMLVVLVAVVLITLILP